MAKFEIQWIVANRHSTAFLALASPSIASAIQSHRELTRAYRPKSTMLARYMTVYSEKVSMKNQSYILDWFLMRTLTVMIG